MLHLDLYTINNCVSRLDVFVQRDSVPLQCVRGFSQLMQEKAVQFLALFPSHKEGAILGCSISSSEYMFFNRKMVNCLYTERSGFFPVESDIDPMSGPPTLCGDLTENALQDSPVFPEVFV